MLRYTTPMMYGAAVVRLQEFCDLLGFDTGPNDGFFGPNTDNAVRLSQEKLGLVSDGIAGPITMKALIDVADEISIHNDARVVDIRGTHPRARLYHRKRPWTEIRGVTLHQTGCNMPQNPRGWLRLNAHDGVTLEGKIAIVNDPADFIWHAQGLSEHTIGLEFEGNHCGIAGDESTLWKGGGPAAHVTEEMLIAADRLFDIRLADFENNNQPWTEIHGHRQSSATRRADPGSEIWQKIAIPWAKKLGLSEADGGEGFKYKKGRVIPVDWNPCYTGKY